MTTFYLLYFYISTISFTNKYYLNKKYYQNFFFKLTFYVENKKIELEIEFIK